MFLKNDQVTYYVYNRTVNQAFQTYAKAEEYAKTLDFAFINVKAMSQDMSSGFSATVSKVKNGSVELIHGRYRNPEVA